MNCLKYSYLFFKYLFIFIQSLFTLGLLFITYETFIKRRKNPTTFQNDFIIIFIYILISLLIIKVIIQLYYDKLKIYIIIYIGVNIYWFLFSSFYD